MRIKHLVFVAVLTTAILCFAFLPAGRAVVNAQSTDVQALIAQLQAQIQILLQQITQLQAQQNQQNSNVISTTPIPEAEWCHTFNQSLGYVNSGSAEVGYLHTALDKEGISYGTDTVNRYGIQTMSAVMKLQRKYGITASGYFGAQTRAKLNALYGCTTTSASVPTPTPIPTTTPASSTQPSITIISSPTGSVLAGSTVHITWTSQGTIKTLGIGFCPAGQPVESNNCTENQSLPNTGSADLNIGNVYNLAPGQWYPVVIDISNTSVNGIGSNFTVVSATSCTTDIDCMVSSTPNSKCVSGRCVPRVSQNLFINNQSSNGPVIVNSGSSATLTWTSSNTTSCVASSCAVSSSLPVTGACPSGNSADPLWSGAVATSGTKTTSPVTKAMVYGLTCTGLSGDSPNNSLGVQPSATTVKSVKIISPNGGETWKVGETHNITWTQTGLASTNVIYINVYNSSNSSRLYEVARLVPVNQGSYAWTIPSTIFGTGLSFPTGSGYNVRIQTQVYDGGYYDDISDANFTIAAATTSCTGYANNTVVLNSMQLGNGAVSFNLTNTTASAQTVSVSIGSGSVSQSTISVPSGACAVPNSITYSAPSSTTITFIYAGSVIASLPVPATTTTSCTGYSDNYVVINSTQVGNGTLSFNLTNTKTSSQTVNVSISSGTVNQTVLTVPAGTCSSPKVVTYTAPSSATITFTNSGQIIASFPVSATTASCAGYADNAVVLNSMSSGAGTVSFNLTNTKSTDQTVLVTIGSGSITPSSILIPAGTCATSKNVTYNISFSTTINFNLASSGQLLANVSVSPSQATYTCTGQTFGNIDYFTKGTTSNSRGDSLTDYCSSATQLLKGYCGNDGSVLNTGYICQYGCNNGACNRQQTQAPTITITSPSGGETWKVGETHNITWTSSGVSTVNIVTGDFAAVQIGMNISASSGSYSWTIPTTVTPGTYRITIYDVNNASSVVATGNSFNIVVQ